MRRMLAEGVLRLRSAGRGECCLLPVDARLERSQVAMGGGGAGGLKWEKDAKDRATGCIRARLDAAADVDASGMLVDDGLANPEAQAGAGGALGGEEGLEDTGTSGGIHAASCICHGD